MGLINSLKGRVDIYQRNGVWVVAGWPSKTARPPNAEQLENQAIFTNAAKAPGYVANVVRDGWSELAGRGRGYSWLDLLRKQIMLGDDYGRPSEP